MCLWCWPNTWTTLNVCKGWVLPLTMSMLIFFPIRLVFVGATRRALGCDVMCVVGCLAGTAGGVFLLGESGAPSSEVARITGILLTARGVDVLGEDASDIVRPSRCTTDPLPIWCPGRLDTWVAVGDRLDVLLLLVLGGSSSLGRTGGGPLGRGGGCLGSGGGVFLITPRRSSPDNKACLNTSWALYSTRHITVNICDKTYQAAIHLWTNSILANFLIHCDYYSI